MRLDIDTYKEIIDTLTRNKSRSFLTGFGVFWGVFMLIILIGGGRGLKETLNNNFDGFASNALFVFTGNTTMPYEGFRKGRQWSMTDEDLKRIKHQVPEVNVVTPMAFGPSSIATNEDKKTSCNITGLKSGYQYVQAPKLFYGRYINDMDDVNEKKVCVIGKKIYKDLFPEGGNPCGKRIKVGDTYFQIIGVDYYTSSININGSAPENIVLPFSVCRKLYNYGNTVHAIAMTGHNNIKMDDITPKIRKLISRVHHINPEDKPAINFFNTEMLFSILEGLFNGVNYLIWLIGIGTILAGAIGVSNIMMVTVKERTTEIGIRRAIGATPKMILSQILSESFVLTIIAGMSGILFGVLILQMIEMANTTDGIIETHYQVNFWTAIVSALLLSSLGMIAGLAPAFRAMSIKPVDAMRDE